MTEEIIFADDPRSATYRTDVRGWVSRDGRFYGDGPQAEELARAAGATHFRCNSCGAPVEARRYFRLCDQCKKKRDEANFLAMPEPRLSTVHEALRAIDAHLAELRAMLEMAPTAAVRRDLADAQRHRRIILERLK